MVPVPPFLLNLILNFVEGAFFHIAFMNKSQEESAAYTEIELDEDGDAEMLDEFDPGDLDLGSDGA